MFSTAFICQAVIFSLIAMAVDSAFAAKGAPANQDGHCPAGTANDCLTAPDDNCITHTESEKLPVADARRCFNKHFDPKLQRLNVLPGSGWDNLRNVEQGGHVVQLNFSQCKTTDDGHFLLPDSVTAVPILSSNIQTTSQLIGNMQEWTSADSESVNINTGLDAGSLKVSGSFSQEHNSMKSKQIGEDSVSTRAQARYVRYAVHLQPDSPLHPAFRARLLDIAAAHQLNEAHQARYLAQLLVRDFGTHVITGALAGAALLKIDHLDKKWTKQHEENKNDIKASASASFAKYFSLSVSTEFSSDKEFEKNYQQNKKSSEIKTNGGPVYLPNNFTVDQWASNIDGNLVFLDRSGDPLHFLVTDAALPELPSSTVQEVAKSVQEAIIAYYRFNTLPGCTDPDSPNFSPAANYDDGACKPPSTNLTFGGVYQTCELAPHSNNGDLCKNDSLVQVNPMTGSASCPAGYQPILLHQGSVESSRTEHHCSHFLFWRFHCHDTQFNSTANYEIYWCLADGPVQRDSGYLFGGLYTSQVANPVTQKSSCPSMYQTLKVGANADLHICVSDDFEDGTAYAVSFAGFVSCSAGNPLALSGKSGSGSLSNFLKSQPSTWPQRCPDGYSKHLATIDQGCEINYCVQTHTMNPPNLPPIRRPPFMHPPAVPAPPKDNLIVFDRYSRIWYRNERAREVMIALQPSNPAADWSKMSASRHISVPLSAGAVAGVSIAGTLACVLLLAVAVLMVRRHRRRREYQPIRGPVPVNPNQYTPDSESTPLNGGQ